jgi:hypothetical protein
VFTIALIVVIGVYVSTKVGWLDIGVILTTLHLGLSDVVTGGLRLAGYPVRRLFADPLTSRSLGEFWTSRWNAAFVEMNQLIVVPFLRRTDQKIRPDSGWNERNSGGDAR